MKGFLIEIDGRPVGVNTGELSDAKADALARATDGESVKITCVYDGLVPSDAHYWDYEISAWVYCANAAQAEPRRRAEKGQ